MQNLTGQAILIVQDDYFGTSELAEHFRDAQARVVGPFPTVRAALVHAAAADLAVLDLNLRDQKVYPLADRLMGADIRFVFYSAQDMAAIPGRFAHVPRLIKPTLAPRDAVCQPDGQARRMTLDAMLPRLRLSARLMLGDALAADRLVEATLRLALQEQTVRGQLPPLSGWLQQLMNRALALHGRDLLN